MHCKELTAYIKELIRGSVFEDKTYLVGGCVRDELLGRPSKDIDIVVALPSGGIDLAKYIGKRINKKPVIYENFGTAMLNFSGLTYMDVIFDNSDQLEFVQTRKESYKSKDRKPEVSFGTKEDDAFRRDFTINALYKDIVNDEILDLTQLGISDLKNKVLRTTNDPDIIFKEDPLRMMRAIRFWLKYNLTMAPDLLQGLKDNAKYILDISAERIQDELNKILVLDNPDNAIDLMQKVGLIHYVLPELEELLGLNANPKYHSEDSFRHTLAVLKNTPPDLITRLSALFHDIGKGEAKEYLKDKGYYQFHGHDKAGQAMVKTILSRLKYSNEVIDTVSDVVANHMWSILINQEPTEKMTRKLLNKLKADVNILLSVMESDMVLSHVDSSSAVHDQNKKNLDTFKQHIDTITKSQGSTVTKVPISGTDIMDRFNLQPSKKVGELLDIALEYIYDHPNASKDEVLKYLDSII
jgi:tRNA nucleotidyltransferase/poly(A) polymerase